MSVTEKHEVKSKFRSMFSFLFDRNSFFYYLLLLITVGFAFFTYALFTEHFTTPFSGDYSQQAYPFYYNFYDDWWTFFKTGKFPFYDSNTFIGADNVFANTYYGLFSPFTFPILFFPRSFIPQAMALLSIAKLVTGGLLFRVYLKYMGCSRSPISSLTTKSLSPLIMNGSVWYDCVVKFSSVKSSRYSFIMKSDFLSSMFIPLDNT